MANALLLAEATFVDATKRLALDELAEQLIDGEHEAATRAAPPG